MTKLLVFTLAAVLTGSMAWGAAMDEGTKELGVSGVVDFDTAADTYVALAVSYGEFLMDGVLVGGGAGFADDDISTRWTLGGFAEYNVLNDSQVIPYVRGFLSYSGTEVDIGLPEKLDDDALVLGIAPGAKYMLRENLAIDLAFVFEWASQDIYLENDGIADTNARVDIGLRFFFD